MLQLDAKREARRNYAPDGYLITIIVSNLQCSDLSFYIALQNGKPFFKGLPWKDSHRQGEQDFQYFYHKSSLYFVLWEFFMTQNYISKFGKSKF